MYIYTTCVCDGSFAADPSGEAYNAHRPPAGFQRIAMGQLWGKEKRRRKWTEEGDCLQLMMGRDCVSIGKYRQISVCLEFWFSGSRPVLISTVASAFLMVPQWKMSKQSYRNHDGIWQPTWHFVNLKCSRIEDFTRKFLRIFRVDTLMVLVLKMVDIIAGIRSGKNGPACTVHEHGHWPPAVNTQNLSSYPNV